ncbi:hypothetical protein [Ferrimonas futtsuensis]|uniref:hypothetical protein n=1 Tax=Ferrimonas futtsuensis TaxID=364764 RepID=UPI000415B21B|nr:hypothetical protein [Ferrimonas futtsuensis]
MSIKPIQSDSTSTTKRQLLLARNDAYAFDPQSNEWLLDLNDHIHLHWIAERQWSYEGEQTARKLLAYIAQHFAPSTVNNYSYALKFLTSPLDLTALKIQWPNLRDSRKILLTSLLSHWQDAELPELAALAKFAKNHCPPVPPKKVLDPEKGTYSEYEYASIRKELYAATQKQLRRIQDPEINLLSPEALSDFGTLVALQLMIGITRRPCQLVQVKWSDILPIGASFSDHRFDAPTPEQEPQFSDVDGLHVRTFRGKDGQFRADLERRSHPLSPELSTLIRIYRQAYLCTLLSCLKKQRITLPETEQQTLFQRCPVFAAPSLFKTEFGSKAILFQALGSNSEAYHCTYSKLNNAMRVYQKRLNLTSDRIADDKLLLGNNRLRHHVLTEGARQGLPLAYLAAITGVTIHTVRAYVDLSFEARLDIDGRMALSQVLRKFGKQSLAEVQQENYFMVKDEFDQELGWQHSQIDCALCPHKQNNCARLACYPCSNFRPHPKGDHHRSLVLAKRKMELNQRNGASKSTLKHLRLIVLYIEATICVCHQYNLAEKGVGND